MFPTAATNSAVAQTRSAYWLVRDAELTIRLAALETGRLLSGSDIDALMSGN
jgi:hypothetical protein